METARSFLARIGAQIVGERGASCEARWRGAPLRLLTDDSARLAAVARAVEALADLRRRDTGGEVHQFVPIVSAAQASALQVLSGDGALLYVDRESGGFHILTRDVAGAPVTIRHLLPRATMDGAPARSAAGVVPCEATHDAAAALAKLRRLLPLLACVRCGDPASAAGTATGGGRWRSPGVPRRRAALRRLPRPLPRPHRRPDPAG